MTERCSLVEGLKATPKIDPDLEKAFLFGAKEPPVEEPTPAVKPTQISNVGRSPLSTRVRNDIAALSSELRLSDSSTMLSLTPCKIFCNIALEDWLNANGYIKTVGKTKKFVPDPTCTVPANQREFIVS